MHNEEQLCREFEKLVGRHRKLIRFLCQGASYGQEIYYKDLMQECYVMLLKKMSELEPGTSELKERAWVFWQSPLCAVAKATAKAVGEEGVALLCFVFIVHVLLYFFLYGVAHLEEAAVLEAEFALYLLVGGAGGHEEETATLGAVEAGGEVVDGELRDLARDFADVGHQLLVEEAREAFQLIAVAGDGIAAAPEDP